MRLEAREPPSRLLPAAAPLGAVALPMLLAPVPLLPAGAHVRVAYQPPAVTCLCSPSLIAETLTRATPLVLTGLAAAVAFRARLWNVGAEGQLYLGAVAAVALGSGAAPLPSALLLPLVLLGGAAAGALLMLGPTLLKLRLDV